MSGLWAQRDFRRLWLGRTVAAAGFHVGVLALQLTAAVSLSASPFEMGLLVAAQSAPALGLSLMAGVWVDRFRRRRLLVGADLGRALIGAHSIGLFAALTPLAGLLPAPLVLPALIVANIDTGFMAPIYGVNEVTLRQSLVEDRVLGRMAATSAFLFNGVMPVGALVGGALAAVIGLRPVLGSCADVRHRPSAA